MIRSRELDLIAPADLAACGCCPRVLRTVEDIQAVMAKHPAEFDEPTEHALEEDDPEVAIDRALEPRDRWAEGGMRVQEPDHE